ncbi:MAG: class I SAM-dependent methyltransferase [Clostridia bacterium]|nr:class I SAM-dependent methyltransferase [Clostridia bacterium]
MNDHYYTRDPSSEHDIHTFEAEVCGNRLRFETDSGVFSRNGLDEGTRILLEALPRLQGRILDLCCGWGPIGIALLRANEGIDMVMTDVNTRAVDLAEKNLRINRCSAKVLQGEGLEKVEGTFDAIVTNPPIRAGKAVIYPLFEQCADRLRENGALYLVIRKQQGAPSCVKFLKEIYGKVDIIEREKGYWVIRAGRTASSGDISDLS